MKTWHPLTWLVIVLGAVGALYIWWTDRTAGPNVARSIDREAPAAAGSADLPELPGAARMGELPPLERFAAMVERPLFSPTRRASAAPSSPPPAEPVFETVEPGAPPQPRILFVGTMRHAGETVALVTGEDVERVRALRPGDEVEGWRVMHVDDRHLTLGLGEEEVYYAIFE